MVPSVTGGYVYRGKRNASYYGSYIFGDFESKRIWALTQAGRQLIKVRQIGESPQKIASFGVDADGELLLVGYEGTIYRLVLDESDFGPDSRKAHVRLVRNNAPAAARVSIVGSDGKPYGPAGTAIRKTKRDESYFYADDSFDVKLPPGRATLNISGGIETIPQTVTLDAGNDHRADGATAAMDRHGGARLVFGRFARPSSHGRPDRGDGLRTRWSRPGRRVSIMSISACRTMSATTSATLSLITGKPHAVSTDRHLLVFGEEMRSTIYGHMQFFGINRLVEPQYTGFDDTPNRHDFPANYVDGRERGPSGGRRDLRSPHVRRPAVSVR